jgi:FBD
VKDARGIFQNLKWIKITNFEGSPIELKLVKFLLEKAIVLESIFLVMKRCDKSNDSSSLRIVQEQISILPKASKDAHVVLCGSSDHDCMINPTHTTYHQEKFQYGITLHHDYATRGGNVLLDQEFL